ncbi:MAG: glycosyltransferase family 4 protein [Solirubrobacterales bacterium]|nr:glycosyltransferase family 4 protein [Solirubrobacterales bacterium]
MIRPVLFVTNHVPPDRAGAFRALHEREGIELALFGGRSQHATTDVGDPGVPHRRVTQREVHALAASGRYRAVVCGTAGRTALPAAWRGARRGGVPFLLWSALWGELATPAHLLARPLMAAIYRDATAVVAYGPHVAAFARRHGARRVHVAPQAVDNAFWAAGAANDPVLDKHTDFLGVFVGRGAREKGAGVLRSAWRSSGLGASAALVLVGAGLEPPRAGAGGAVRGTQDADGIVAVGVQSPQEIRNFYAHADVVLIPSLASRRFREPWGLVANEAMNQHTPIIATDAVGAAAGGLVRHERNGLIVPAGDEAALAAAIRRLHDHRDLRLSLGAAGARDVAAYTYEAWAGGFSAALGETASSGRGW